MEKNLTFLISNGHKINYEFINKSYETQDKPFLIFLHEGLGSIKQWREFPVLLSNKVGYPALLYDRYGYGKSESLREPRKTNFMDDEALKVLPEILEALNINKTILIGHSDGGTIALIYASVFKEKVICVITEAAHVFVEKESIEGVRSAVRAYKKGALKRLLYQFHKDNTESMFYGWADIWLSEDFKDWNIKNILPRIEAPVLAVQGKDDEYGTVNQVNSILNNVSGPAESLLIENCGHIPHFQAEEKVLNKMTEFILKYSKC
jgi:pimeloyl-ACP methyl ester carboxylesterase